MLSKKKSYDSLSDQKFHISECQRHKHSSHAHLQLFAYEIHLLSTGAVSPSEDLVVNCGDKRKEYSFNTRWLKWVSSAVKYFVIKVHLWENL